MRSLVLTLALALAAFTAGAQTPADPMTLADAVRLGAEIDSAVVNARADLSAAERDLDRSEADPLALRVPVLQARQAVEAAQAGLVTALIDSRLAVSQAYFTALGADDTLALAEQQRDISSVTLEAEQVRLDAGAATQLDVDRAGNNLDDAERDVASAANDRALADAELRSLLGSDVAALTPASDAPALAELAAVLADAQARNAQLAATGRALALAEAQLAAVDNAFSARTDIESAQDRLGSARLNVEETARSLELTVRSSYNAVLSAEGRWVGARADLATAQEDLEAQRARLDAGSISPLSYRQTELSAANSASSAARALNDLLLAHLRLEQTVMGR